MRLIKKTRQKEQINNIKKETEVQIAQKLNFRSIKLKTDKMQKILENIIYQY